MTVGKTFVADALRGRGEEILRLRRELRRHPPRQFATGVLWGLDWTFVAGPGGDPRAVLGVIDHGSRACLELREVESRRTIVLLRYLLDLFERFGTPKVLRTDNEPACRSALFCVVLRLLCVRHQRTAPFAPWQNGRIERLFRTVKEALANRSAVVGGVASAKWASTGFAPGTTTCDPTRLSTGSRRLKPGTASRSIGGGRRYGSRRGTALSPATTGLDRDARSRD